MLLRLTTCPNKHASMVMKQLVKIAQKRPERLWHMQGCTMRLTSVLHLEVGARPSSSSNPRNNNTDFMLENHLKLATPRG
eukprot:593331-Pelagomonas_calceolata.AAC.1